MTEATRYQSFREFYPFYLGEHQNTTCRRLHVVGSSMVLALLLYALLTVQFKLLILLPVIGYGFAWVGHFYFEKNRPATFTYPLYSLIGDYQMWWDVVTGKIKW